MNFHSVVCSSGVVVVLSNIVDNRHHHHGPHGLMDSSFMNHNVRPVAMLVPYFLD